MNPETTVLVVTSVYRIEYDPVSETMKIVEESKTAEFKPRDTPPPPTAEPRRRKPPA